jgi:5-methylcytosine-specific restriction protein A
VTALCDSYAWQRLRAAVKARDGHRCVVCGRAADRLDVDHIIDWKLRPDLALDPTNLRAVCRPCHNRKATRRQPKRRNTRRW